MNGNETKVKICGMRELENLFSIALLQPEYVGFIFYPASPRYVSVADAEKLPVFRDVRRVGVFVNEETATILDAVERLGLFAVQLHGGESPADCAALKIKKPELKVIKAFAMGNDFDGARLMEYEDVCDHFLFDTKTDGYGGSGESFDWEILRSFPIGRPFFLSGGIGEENIREAVDACAGLPLYAVDLNSRVEVSPGVKSTEMIEKVLRQL